MMSETIFNVPYLLYFIPLLSSIFMYFIDAKRFLTSITYIVLSVMLFLSLILLSKLDDKLIIVNSTTKYNIIGSEFKVTFYNVFIITLVMFINIISFINYIKGIILKKSSNIEYIEMFFSTFFLYIFSIIGIIMTDNIFHLFLFLELYSFCIYMIITNYNDKNLLIVSYRYFSNNIFGSILSMLSIFYMTIYFNTSSLLSIKQQLLTISIKENPEIFFMFLLLIFSITIKFFSNSTSKLLNNDNVGINFISISNIFINTLIGIYLLSSFIFYLFPKDIIIFFIDKIIIFISSISIIYNSYMLIKPKIKNSIFNIFTRFNLIYISYILTFIFLNKNSEINIILDFIINYISISILIYFFSEYISQKYNTNEIDILNKEKIYKYFFIFIILFNLYIPFTTASNITEFIVKYSIENTEPYLLIPFILNKTAVATLIYKICFNKRKLDIENVKNEKNLVNIKTSIIIITVLTFFINFR